MRMAKTAAFLLGVPLIPVHFTTVAAPSIHVGFSPMPYKIPF